MKCCLACLLRQVSPTIPRRCLLISPGHWLFFVSCRCMHVYVALARRARFRASRALSSLVSALSSGGSNGLNMNEDGQPDDAPMRELIEMLNLNGVDTHIDQHILGGHGHGTGDKCSSRGAAAGAAGAGAGEHAPPNVLRKPRRCAIHALPASRSILIIFLSSLVCLQRTMAVIKVKARGMKAKATRTAMMLMLMHTRMHTHTRKMLDSMMMMCMMMATMRMGSRGTRMERRMDTHTHTHNLVCLASCFGPVSSLT